MNEMGVLYLSGQVSSTDDVHALNEVNKIQKLKIYIG